MFFKLFYFGSIFCSIFLCTGNTVLTADEGLRDRDIKLSTVYECNSDHALGSESRNGDKRTANAVPGYINEILTITVGDPGLRFERDVDISQYVFRFKKNPTALSCLSKGNFRVITMPVKLNMEVEADGKKQYVLISGDSLHPSLMREVGFLPTGHLAEGIGGHVIFYEPKDYCIRKVNATHTEFQLCVSFCPSQYFEICIKKCCPPGSTISFHQSSIISESKTNMTKNNNVSASEFQTDATRPTSPTPSCQPSGGKRWKPTFWNSTKFSDGILVETMGNEPEHKIVWAPVKKACSKSLAHSRTKIELYDELLLPSYNWRLLDNGSLVMNTNNNATDSLLEFGIGTQWKVLEHSFCIDGIHNFGHVDEAGGIVSKYAGHQERSHQLIYVCYD